MRVIPFNSRPPAAESVVPAHAGRHAAPLPVRPVGGVAHRGQPGHGQHRHLPLQPQHRLVVGWQLLMQREWCERFDSGLDKDKYKLTKLSTELEAYNKKRICPQVSSSGRATSTTCPRPTSSAASSPSTPPPPAESWIERSWRRLDQTARQPCLVQFNVSECTRRYTVFKSI